MVSPPSNSNPTVRNQKPEASVPQRNQPRTDANTPSGSVPGPNPTGCGTWDKRKSLQQQLLVLLHAKKCKVPSGCPVILCTAMKEAHQHMDVCKNGKECRFPHCASSYQILKHWKACKRDDCGICQPLRNNKPPRPYDANSTTTPANSPTQNDKARPVTLTPPKVESPAADVKNMSQEEQPESQKVHVTVDNIGEKKKFIQQQLYLLLHAKDCLDLDSQARCTKSPIPRCTVNHCTTMKGVLKHMHTCTVGRECLVAHCASSHQILAHWRKCKKISCSVCRPLTNSKSSNAATQTQHKVSEDSAAVSTKLTMGAKSPTQNDEGRPVEPPASAAVVRSTRLGDKVVPLALTIQFKQLQMIMK